MIDLPPILDFEASSLSDGSYPITAGLVIQGKVHHWVIKPQPDWVDWSLASQAVHGIKRSELMDFGMPADEVYAQIGELLNGVPIIYSDNPYWESRWLRCLGKFDCEIQDIRELIPVATRQEWPMSLGQTFEVSKLIRHRADHDAYAMYLTVLRLSSDTFNDAGSFGDDPIAGIV